MCRIVAFTTLKATCPHLDPISKVVQKPLQGLEGKCSEPVWGASQVTMNEIIELMYVNLSAH